MIERIKRGAAMILAACMLAVMLPAQTVYAANAKLAFSDPSATVGGQVSVNMKITSSGDKLSSADVTVTYDANALEFISGTDAEGGSGKIRIHGDGGTPNTGAMAFTLKFNARAAGTTKIEVSNQEIYDSNSQLVTLDKQGSSTVTVSALATASKDATLKSLKISPGTLTPEFSPNVDTYAVTVGMDVDKIIVSAEANDENATKVIKGNEGLQMGENRVTCLVTAQDGETSKEYVIVVTKAEGGATAAAGNSGDQVKLSASARTITIMEPDENTKLPAGFVETLVNIDGHKVKGWVWSSDKDRQYCVVYGMNEAGEKNFYRYDLGENEKTIQRYFQDPAADTGVSTEKYEALATDYNNLLKDYNSRMIVIVVLAVVAVILLILFIWQILSKDKKGGPDRDPGSSRGSKRRKEPIEAEESQYAEDEYGDGPYDDEDMPEDEGYDDGYGEEAVTGEAGFDMTELEEDDEDVPELRYEPLRPQVRNQRPVRRPRGEAAGEYRENSARGEEAGKRLPRPVPAARNEEPEESPVRPSRKGAAVARQARGEEYEDVPVRQARGEEYEDVPVRRVRGEEYEDVPVRQARGGEYEDVPVRQARGEEYEDVPVRRGRGEEYEDVPVRQSRGEEYEDVPVRQSRGREYEDVPVRRARGGEYEDVPVRQARGEEYEDVPVRQARGGEYEDVSARRTRGGEYEDASARQSRGGEYEDIPVRRARGGEYENLPAHRPHAEEFEDIPARRPREDEFEEIPERPSRSAGERPGRPARTAAAKEQPANVRQLRPETVREYPARPAADRPARAAYPSVEEYPARSPRPAASQSDDDDDFDLMDIE